MKLIINLRERVVLLFTYAVQVCALASLKRVIWYAIKSIISMPLESGFLTDW